MGTLDLGSIFNQKSNDQMGSNGISTFLNENWETKIISPSYKYNTKCFEKVIKDVD